MDAETYKIVKRKMREDHYNSGGTPSMWRGVSNVYKNKKKEHNKNKCREYREEE